MKDNEKRDSVDGSGSSDCYIAACPFCGELPDWSSIEVDDITKDYYINCACCECQGPRAPKQEKAIDLWNHVCPTAVVSRESLPPDGSTKAI